MNINCVCDRRRLFLSAALILGLFLFASGCQRKARDVAASDVVVIVADALRPDRMSAYGHWQRTTPFLEQLARDGVRAETAYAVSSWAVPSMATLLTGVLPRDHGCRFGLIEPDGRIIGQQSLPETRPVLPELFRDAGYDTLGVSANPFVTADMGYARGFSRFESVSADNPAEVTDRLLALDAGRSGQSPRFVLAHYAGLQLPRQVRMPWAAGFAGGHTNYQVWAGLDEAASNALVEKIVADTSGKEGETDHAGNLFRGIRVLYDSELRELDNQIQRLIEGLNLANDALIIVTGSHGEEMLEHGRIGHGASLFEPALRVPLIARQTGRLPAGLVIGGVMWLPDAHQTLAEFFNAPGTAGNDDSPTGALSLYALAREGTAPAQRLMLFETVKPRDLSVRAVRAGPWKMMLQSSGGEMSTWLTHLEHDPNERRNVAEHSTGVVDELTGAMKQWWGM